MIRHVGSHDTSTVGHSIPGVQLMAKIWVQRNSSVIECT